MRTHGVGVFLLGVVGLACGSSAAKVGAGDAAPLVFPPDSGTGVGKDAAHDAVVAVDAPPAPCGSPDASPTEACGALALTTSSVTSRPRNHHVTLTTTLASGVTMLYAIGGADVNSVLGNVDRVPLNADGSLGAWVAEPPLLTPSGGLVAEIVGNVIVVAGGRDAFGYTNLAASAVIQPDGSLSPWSTAPGLSAARMHGGSITRGSTVWVLGGFANSQIWGDVESATVAPDGTVSAWQPAGQLPGAMSHFTVNLVGEDDVYLTGGLAQPATGNPPDLAATWHGKILADGTLGSWVQGPDLLVAEAAHAAFVYGGHLTVCGGINDVPAEEDRCWRSPIAADRSLGAWAETATLPFGRGHVHQMPVVGSTVYAIAGAIDFNLDSSTQIVLGTFTGAAAMIKRDRPPPILAPPHGAKCHLGE